MASLSPGPYAIDFVRGELIIASPTPMNVTQILVVYSVLVYSTLKVEAFKIFEFCKTIDKIMA